MSLRKLKAPSIDVDMVPLIDIVTLLLMFLVVVGDTAATAQAVNVNLPRADQALPDSSPIVRKEGRIVISLIREAGQSLAVINGRAFEAGDFGGSQATLMSYLEETALYQYSKGLCRKNSHGSYDIPVKLRIANDCPMAAVEAVLMDVARVNLRDIQYAALPPEPAQ